MAVLGSTCRDHLFGEGVDPTGQLIRIRSQPFRVAGVMASKGQAAMGEDQDDTIFVPFTTVQKKLLGITHIQNITVSASSADAVPNVAERHHHPAARPARDSTGEHDDFMVRTLEEMATSARKPPER